MHYYLTRNCRRLSKNNKMNKALSRKVDAKIYLPIYFFSGEEP